VKYRVFFAAEAQADLLELYEYIAERSGDIRALAYIARLEQWCASFDTFPQRGTPRDDIRPGLRITGFERRISVAFTVEDDVVTILRILYGGVELEDSLS